MVEAATAAALGVVVACRLPLTATAVVGEAAPPASLLNQLAARTDLVGAVSGLPLPGDAVNNEYNSGRPRGADGSYATRIAAVCRLADILVVAVGQPEMVKADWVKPGAVVLDVGMNRVPSKDPEKAAAGKTRLVGDVDFGAVSPIASQITPVPGGIGPMTIACLLRNAVQACAAERGVRLSALV